MKRFLIALIALVAMTTTTFAQNDENRQDRPKFDPTEMLKKRTEATAKRYGLDEAQTAKLQELNSKYAKSMMPAPRMRPQRDGRRDRQERDSVNRPQPKQPTEEQKAKMQQRQEEEESEMLAYNEALQSIMTADQYKHYLADMQRKMLQPQQR